MIFFVPPIFVIAGVAVVLIGMYVQWIRWRMHKPLAFARYPKWDLNVARERKALLAVAIGAAILCVPGDLWRLSRRIFTPTPCHSAGPLATP